MSRTNHARPPRISKAFVNRALEAVKDHDGITIPQLAEHLECDQRRLYRVLPALVRDGEVEKAGRHWYLAGTAPTCPGCGRPTYRSAADGREHCGNRRCGLAMSAQATTHTPQEEAEAA